MAANRFLVACNLNVLSREELVKIEESWQHYLQPVLAVDLTTCEGVSDRSPIPAPPLGRHPPPRARSAL